MFCNSCGKEVEEGATFCPFCGNKITVINPDMGVSDAKKLAKGETIMLDTGRQNMVSDNQQFEPGKLPVKKEIPVTIRTENKGNTIVKVLLIVVLVLVAIGGLASYLLKRVKDNEPEKFIYLKNNTLYLADMDGSKTSEIGMIQEEDCLWRYEGHIYVSDDTKYILYGLEKEDSDTVDLYYSVDGDEASLICEDVSEYYLSKNKAIYRVDDDLYSFYFKNKDEEKITDNIISCTASEYNDRIAYIDDDNMLCIASSDNDDIIEIDDGATLIYGCSSNMKHIVYAKDKSLYVCTVDQDPELISDTFDSEALLISEGEKLNICYKTPDMVSAYMFVDDDLDEDEAVDVRQRLQYTRVFEDGEFAALNIYKKDLEKDSEGVLSSVTGGLGLAKYIYYDMVGDEMVCLMSFVESDDIPKIKLSEFEDEYGTDFDNEDVEALVMESVKNKWQTKISRKGVTNDCDALKGTVCGLVADSKNSDCCYIALYKGDDKYEIGKMNLRGKKTGHYESLYRDGQRLWLAIDGKVVYTDKSGDLLVNDTHIDKSIDSVEIMK